MNNEKLELYARWSFLHVYVYFWPRRPKQHSGKNASKVHVQYMFLQHVLHTSAFICLAIKLLGLIVMIVQKIYQKHV